MVYTDYYKVPEASGPALRLVEAANLLHKNPYVIADIARDYPLTFGSALIALIEDSINQWPDGYRGQGADYLHTLVDDLADILLDEVTE